MHHLSCKSCGTDFKLLPELLEAEAADGQLTICCPLCWRLNNYSPEELRTELAAAAMAA